MNKFLTILKKNTLLLATTFALICALVFGIHNLIELGLVCLHIFVLVPFFCFLGFFLGKTTCHVHERGRTFSFVLVLFVVVNFIHSAIDGASVSLDSKTSILAVGLHEIVRQYILYVTTIRLFKNKNIKPIWMSVFIIVLVTGVWVLGSFVGYWLRSNINIYSSYAYIADLFIWIFVGDIFHHWKEEYKKTQSNKHCCH